MIYFSHIPKTAGSSFYKFLEDNFNLDSVFKNSHTNELVNSSFSKINHQLIRGHFPSYKIFQLDSDYLHLTIFRDPITRYLSQINHNIQLGHHSSEYTSPNLMTKWIVRDSLYPCDFNQIDKISDELIFEIASKQINNMHWIGITENYHDSICSLAIMQGWWPTGINYFENKNTKYSASKFQEIDNELFLKINNLDTRLYEQAKNINENLISKARNFAEDLISKNIYLIERLKWLDDSYTENNLQNNSLENLAKLVFLKNNETINAHNCTVSINASNAFVGLGWHRREYSDLTNSYRWSGPETNSLIVINSNISGNILMSIRLNAWCSDLIPEKIEIKLNNIPLNTSVVYNSDFSCTLLCTGFILKVFENTLKLLFKTPTTQILNQFTPTDDSRKVGFSFTNINIISI